MSIVHLTVLLLIGQMSQSQPAGRSNDDATPSALQVEKQKSSDRPPLIPGLEEPYIDGTYAFSIQPPPGWQVMPHRKQDKTDLVLLRLMQVLPDGRFNEISVRQTTLPQRQPMSELLKQRAGELQLQYSNAQILSQQLQQIAGRSGACVMATYWRENREHLRIEALVDAGRRQYMRLVWNGALESRKESEALFGRVLASFALLRDQVTEDELRKALASGEQWLAGLDVKKLHEAVVAEEWLRIELAGKDIGFISVQQSTGLHEKREGIRIKERGWTFEPGGLIRRVQNSMFISDDLKHERWKSSITTLVPSQGEQPQTLDVALEEGLRSDRYLLSNQCYDLMAPSTENPAVTLPKTYLPPTLVRMMPRLAGDRSKSRRLGFTYFDHRKADIVLRVYDFEGEVKPPPEIAEHVSSSRVFQIDEREGLASNPSQLFVDEKGRVLLARSGKLTLTPTTAKEMEAMFHSRVTSAESAMADLEAQANETVQKRFGRKP